MYHDEEHDGYSNSEYADIIPSLRETAAKYGFDYELFFEQYLRVQDLSRNLHFIEEAKKKQAKMYTKHMQALQRCELEQAILDEQMEENANNILLNRLQQNSLNDDYNLGAWGMQSQYSMLPGLSRYDQLSDMPLGYLSTPTGLPSIDFSQPPLSQHLILQQQQQQQLLRQQMQQQQLLYQQQHHHQQQYNYPYMNPDYSSFMDQQLTSQQLLLQEATRVANNGHENLHRQLQIQPQPPQLQQSQLCSSGLQQVSQQKYKNKKKLQMQPHEVLSQPAFKFDRQQQAHSSHSQNLENPTSLQCRQLQCQKKPPVEKITSQLPCEQLLPQNKTLHLPSKQSDSKDAQQQSSTQNDYPLLRQLLQQEAFPLQKELSKLHLIQQRQEMSQQQEELPQKQEELSSKPQECSKQQVIPHQPGVSQQHESLQMLPKEEVQQQPSQEEKQLQPQQLGLPEPDIPNQQVLLQLQLVKKQQHLLHQQLLARKQELPEEQPNVVQQKKKKGKSKRERLRNAEEESRQRLQLLNVQPPTPPPPQLLEEARLFPANILDSDSDGSSAESGISSIIGRPSDNRKLANVILPKSFLRNAIPDRKEVISEEMLRDYENWKIKIEILLETFKNKELDEKFGPERNAALKKVLRNTLVSLFIEKKLGRRMSAEELVQYEDNTVDSLYEHLQGFHEHLIDQIKEIKAVIAEKGLATIARENFLNYDITNDKYPFEKEK